MSLIRNAAPKPLRGAYKLERAAKRSARVAAEQKVMQAAKRRDGGKCRWPRCEFKALAVEPAHMDHRGMGGNPSGDKTQRHKIIALCVRHHDQFDGRAVPDIDIVPVYAEQGTDGPCAFYQRSEWGRMEHVATERFIGISETRRA
jgi:hypothetical protein